MPSLRSLQRGAVAALLVTTAVAVAACGGGSSASSTATTATTSTSAAGAASGANSAAMAKYTACLAQNGVTLPAFGAGGPSGGGGGGGGQGGAPPTGTNAGGGAPTPGGNANFRKAAAACAKLRPAGLRAGGFGGRGGANNAAFAAYRNCLTLHGVKLSQLSPGSSGTPSAKVRKAMTACASLRPQGRAPSSPTATAPITTTS